MQKSKNAFTMIELIFVIVILGILAAVAIPKLSATRTDALVSKTAQNIMMGAGEIASYAISNGITENNLSSMSNGIASLVNSGEAVLDISGNKKATVSFGSTSDCVTIQVLSDANDDNLTISFGAAGGDARCLGLQALIDAKQYPMKLRGQYVK
jgi:general secretion pathway protein G